MRNKNKVINYNERISIIQTNNLIDKDGYPIPVEKAPVIYTC